MAFRWLRPRRALVLAMLAASAAAGVWWLGHVPYDPMAVYRPVPASATLVGRHVELPARWGDLLANPLALALMRTAGVDPEAARDLALDETSRAWFEKLAGREGVLAYLPGRFGSGPVWMAASHLGGESQKLRWQLTLFSVPGFRRMEQFPRRGVWHVETPDLDPRQHLVVAFGEGVIMACLSENPFAMAEVLGAYDGTGGRLLDWEASFRRFAEGDDRRVPDRFWLRDESDFAAAADPGIVVEVDALRGDAIALRAATEGARAVPADRPAAMDLGALARRLGAAPCAAAWVRRDALEALAAQPGVQRDVRHGLRMALEAADEAVAVFLMDGDFGGRLAWGPMRTLGLAGLRVPTLALATPAPNAAAAHAAVQRMLDASNARYRGAFVLRPVAAGGETLHVLESAGGNEWVDVLSRSDRPAYAVLDGWLVAASNLDALQKIARGEAAAEGAEWEGQIASPRAAAAWLDLRRGGKVARDAIATWSMAQMFFDGGQPAALRERLEAAKAWIDALAPFGTARASLGHGAGQTALFLDLGLSAATASDRIQSP